MSWLQKRPQVSNPTNFFTVGLNKTVLIVGLGNPGKKYESTRHNIGFACLDTFAETNDEIQPWVNKKDLKCSLASGQIRDKRVILVKPTTFMNNSGESVQLVANFYKIETSRITVVYDDIDIAFGQIKIRSGGSSAGHNGIKSISSVLGTEDYGRIRIGIGPKKPDSIDTSDYVLQKFSQKEIDQMANLKKEVTAIVTESIFADGLIATETRSFLV